jgi:putative endonuclease
MTKQRDPLVFYSYVLQSLTNGGLYVGMSNNPQRRLAEHNQGLQRSTRQRRPFRLIHVEAHGTRLEARTRERYWKSGRGREVLKELVHGNAGKPASGGQAQRST